MAKHSISEAAKLAGVSRSHLYKKFIKLGVISIERDKDENPVIDTAEIQRVFGQIHGDTIKPVSESHKPTPENSMVNTALQAEIKFLHEQLAGAAEREKWLQRQVEQANTLLLEYKQAPAKKRFWLW